MIDIRKKRSSRAVRIKPAPPAALDAAREIEGVTVEEAPEAGKTIVRCQSEPHALAVSCYLRILRDEGDERFQEDEDSSGDVQNGQLVVVETLNPDGSRRQIPAYELGYVVDHEGGDVVAYSLIGAADRREVDLDKQTVALVPMDKLRRSDLPDEPQRFFRSLPIAKSYLKKKIDAKETS